MTANQISAAKVAEDRRHNAVTEQLQDASNRITSKHYSNSDTATKQHYERSDAINQAHYERADTAGLISANANALNADTSRKQYEMQYDIEYNWTGNYGYPKGMPMSAIERNANLELTTLIQPIFTHQEPMQYTTDEKTGQLREATTREQSYGIDMHTSPARIQREESGRLTNVKLKSEGLKNVASGTNYILNGIFGKQGLVEGVQSIVDHQ